MNFLMGYDMNDLKVIKRISTAPAQGFYMVNIPTVFRTGLSIGPFHYYPSLTIPALRHFSTMNLPQLHRCLMGYFHNTFLQLLFMVYTEAFKNVTY
jgi:hypothetical protein